jgi:hypothetical protein
VEWVSVKQLLRESLAPRNCTFLPGIMSRPDGQFVVVRRHSDGCCAAFRVDTDGTWGLFGEWRGSAAEARRDVTS